jgi:superfamily II DNA/RNA helicase
MTGHRPSNSSDASSRPRTRTTDRQRLDLQRADRPRTLVPATSTPASPGAAPAPLDASFADLGLPPAICAVLARQGIDSPFPIQRVTIADTLAGRDVLGRGRTGSGKTLAFVLPLVARLADTSAGSTRRIPHRPRALIFAPTRELVTQINDAMAPFAAALGLRTATVFGGVGHEPQVRALRNGLDVLVACPGRLCDHVQSRQAYLDAVEVTVLDEADHMADMGFLPDVKRLLDLTPREGQRLLFSATLDQGVDVLVRRYLHDPLTHSVDPAESPVAEMQHHVLQVAHADRLPVLFDLAAAPGRTMVFTRTKHGAKKLTRQLIEAGVPAVEMHGNLGQSARQRNLELFSSGKATTLVATDVAARGIHVDDVGVVIHADPPTEHKAYLHRSGRTARAGASGLVITMATDDQMRDVRDLTTRARISARISKVRTGDPLLSELVPGERAFVEPAPMAPPPPARAVPPRAGTGRPRAAAARSGRGRSWR